MLYFINTSLVLLLALIDLSLMPRLVGFGIPPLLILPLLVILSMRDRTIYPIVLAVMAGLVYDAAVGGGSFIYTLVFLATVLTAKLFFAASQNYNYRRSLIILTVGATALALIGSYQAILVSYTKMSLYIELGLYFLLTLLLLWLYSFVGAKYFDYVEKTTSERFR